jgi:hypothetical protein
MPAGPADVRGDTSDRLLELVGKVDSDGIHVVRPVQGDLADTAGNSAQHVRHM